MIDRFDFQCSTENRESQLARKFNAMVKLFDTIV
jgi:hypothetical protein